MKPKHFWGNTDQPEISYGNWSATPEIKWLRFKSQTILIQKFKRRVKRDWGRSCISRSMEYEWKPVPIETK